MDNWKAFERWDSDRMQRPISLVRWGHYGVPVLVFPTAGGDAEEIERHQLLAHLLALHRGGPDQGLFLRQRRRAGDDRPRRVGGVPLLAVQPVPAGDRPRGGAGDPRGLAGPQEVIVAGASIGAFNSLALISRWPHLFRSAICMSGTFDIEKFIGGFTTDLFFSSPLHFLPGLEGPDLDRLRERFVYLPSGSGAWEDVGESWRAAEVLGAKGVPNRVDDWGPEFDHDWPTWWQMLPNYVEQAL